MTRIVVLGAGFGGLELTTTLSEQLGDSVDITLIDKSDAFVFGYHKFDVLFGRATSASVRHPYKDFVKPGVRLVQETVTAIDAENRRVTTTAGTHEADVLVIALGADYDAAATPGIELGVNEFYSNAGAQHLASVLPTFRQGRILIGGCGHPYKCPPAPSECALMLHDYLVARGVRDDCKITVVIPMSAPVPPSPETSKAILAAFAERSIEFIAQHCVAKVDTGRKIAVLDDGAELAYDLFLGVPKNRAPDCCVAAGITENGWVAINPRTLETKYPDVYALGDCAQTGIPKTGVFAEGAAHAVAQRVIAKLQNTEATALNPGAGSCYIEFGQGKIARVEVDFFSGPAPTGQFSPASAEIRADKNHFTASRVRRWFGR